MELDIEAIRQSPRQFVDLETVIALSDRCMVLALQADEVNAARIYLREKGRLLTELAEKNAEIERLERLADAIDKRAGERIAASQAMERQLREALDLLVFQHHDWGLGDVCSATFAQQNRELIQNARKALALPQDTTALKALIAKAGEVMRERCAVRAMETGDYMSVGKHVAGAIRTLPGVKLEDLK